MVKDAKEIIQNCYCGIEIYEDQDDGPAAALRIVMRSEYPGTSDKVVVRVRALPCGELFQVDDNGEAAFYAGMQGGDETSHAAKSWASQQWAAKRIQLTEDGTLRCQVALAQIPQYIQQMAMAALALFNVAMLDQLNPEFAMR